MTRGRLVAGLLTPWGEALDPDHPLPEYPRPQLVRESYLNLNGRWQYAITATEVAPATQRGDEAATSSTTMSNAVETMAAFDTCSHHRQTATTMTTAASATASRRDADAPVMSSGS